MDANGGDGAWRGWMERFARALVGQGAREDRPGGESRPVEERLLQAVWAEQFLRADALTTASGKRVEVLEPGRWNTGAGPDFLDARLRILGAEVEGDVEIHRDSADWTRHGHHRDFAYNRTVLHAVLRSSDDRPYEELQNGARLERLVIEQAIEPGLETLRATVNLEEYPYGRPAHLGVCHDEFMRLPEAELLEFLDVAGRARVEDRLRRYRAQGHGLDQLQLAYQALMAGQGMASNKTLYFLLSKRAPLGELRDLARDRAAGDEADFHLAALLSIAQLFPAEQDLAAQRDAETEAFLAACAANWKVARPYFRDRLLPPTRRWFQGMRPPGFPTRRLTAVAVLMSRLTDREAPLLGRIEARLGALEPDAMGPKEWRRAWKELAEPLVVEEPGRYFARRFTVGGKEGKALALLGEPAARGLLFNVALPLVLLAARERGDAATERKCWGALGRFPTLEDNSVTRFMKRRLFGDGDPREGYFATELRQQALMRVFTDCCSHNERTCADCAFLSLGERLRSAEARGA
ncbi:MAG: DUF2851 family protein [Candidatus Sumerlaeia bacterium]|nr:DUF2851 family protein [Candidatus Sumerlaeia bacterium]